MRWRSTGRHGALHVVGNHVVAVFKGREGLRDTQQADGGARACAQRQHGPLARAADEIENVAVKIAFDANGANLIARSSEKLGGERLNLRVLEQVCAAAVVMPLEHLPFFVRRWDSSL